MYAKPTVGSEVEVVIQRRETYIYATNPIRTTHLRGVVVADLKNTPPNCFRMVVNCENVPNREVDLTSIAELRYLDGQSARRVATPSQTVKTWQFTGSRGDAYTVTRQGTKYSCTCPGFTFRKNCKHTKLAAEQK